MTASLSVAKDKLSIDRQLRCVTFPLSMPTPTACLLWRTVSCGAVPNARSYDRVCEMRREKKKASVCACYMAFIKILSTVDCLDVNAFFLWQHLLLTREAESEMAMDRRGKVRSERVRGKRVRNRS